MAKLRFCVPEFGSYTLQVGYAVQMMFEYYLTNYLMFVFTPNRRKNL